MYVVYPRKLPEITDMCVAKAGGSPPRRSFRGYCLYVYCFTEFRAPRGYAVAAILRASCLLSVDVIPLRIWTQRAREAGGGGGVLYVDSHSYPPVKY